MRGALLISVSLLLTITSWTLSVEAQVKPASAPVDSAGMEFFEKKIRPILVQHCYSCHSQSAKVAKGNLALDQRSAMMKGGAGGAAVVPGDPDKSRLIEAVRYTHAGIQMPPKGKLPESVIADLCAWVKMGAPAPDEPLKAAGRSTPSDPLREKRLRAHWAWRPLKKSPIPVVKRKGWVKNPIDAFLLAKLEAKGLSPVGYADRRTLIRRAHFDLIGLPPSPEETEAFLNDKSPQAWEKVVDSLLANPHYGERWGRYWLDIARYGEDQAHSFEPRLYPQGFRYRDWIVRSLNADMGYNRFVKEQIAADLLDEPNLQERIPALGFFATGPVYYGDSKMFDQYDDRIDTLTRGLLGLTVACARCHDHKFDPISQKEYYGLAGIFANTSYREVALEAKATQNANVKSDQLGNRGEILKKKQAEVDAFVKEHTQYVRQRLTPEIAKYMVQAWRYTNRKKATPALTVAQYATAEKLESVVLDRWVNYLTQEEGKKNPDLAEWHKAFSGTGEAEIQKIADAFQTKVQSVIQAKEAQKNAKPALKEQETALLEAIVGEEGVLTVPSEILGEVLSGDPKARYATISTELQRLKVSDFAHALADTPKAGNIRVLLRGNPETPGEEAPRKFLTILAGDNAPTFTKGSGRLELAEALTAESNPLTPRVMVNRIWKYHFGTGIVRTTNNFGTLGEPPTHPELLDYLTADFVANGWSLKALHRKIMLSAAYRMSSRTTKHNQEIDPDNRFVWRMPVRRLEIEAFRDAILSVTGTLDQTIGGQSLSLDVPENRRRTFYASISRHDLNPMLRLFDFPDPNVTADKRTDTTVPLQQLFMLNSEYMIREAKAFAVRLNANPQEDNATRIRRAYLLAFNRPPMPKEIALGLRFLASVPASPAQTPTITKTASLSTENSAKLTRWEQYAQMLLCANEFIYID